MTSSGCQRFPLHASAQEAGQRLDVFLSRRMRCSRNAICQRLSQGVLDSAGKTLKWSHRLSQDEIVFVPALSRPEPNVPVEFRILYQDQALVAVDKGSGAPVHPTRSFRSRTILTFLKERLALPGLGPAHRLDRETSGVLLFGTNRAAIAALMKQFSTGLVRKRYLAVVRGNPDFEKRRVELPLSLDVKFPIRCRMKVDPISGKPAITELEVLERHADRALVAALPCTGRQHQIRVHLAAVGFPVLGDKLYQQDGRPYLAMIRDALDPEALHLLGHHRQALHAQRLECRHPQSGQSLVFEAPLPEDLRQLLAVDGP